MRQLVCHVTLFYYRYLLVSSSLLLFVLLSIINRVYTLRFLKIKVRLIQD